MRAIAVAVAWDEALDRGGDSVPADPRYGEAFLEYLWRVQRGDLTIADLGHYFAIEERRQAERAAFAAHLSSVVAVTPQASEPSPAPPASAEESRQP